MKITILDVLKRRNNAVSVLVEGLCSGLGKLGVDYRIVKYSQEWPDGSRILDPASIPEDTTTLLVPYWISSKIWNINLADVRRRLPSVRIVCYTGTSPYWHGSVPSYVPETRGIDCSGLSPEQVKNFDAIDVFAVVRQRPGINPPFQRQVGMGVAPEIAVGRKAPHPFVILDTMKQGWDESAYARSVEFVERAMREVEGLRLVALGTNEHTTKLATRHGVRILPGDFIPFEQVAALWSTAWAFVCHNESFGYPIVENAACGTRVFCSPGADVPPWHSGIVSGVEDMIQHLSRWKVMTPEERQGEAQASAAAYRDSEPDLFCWKSAVEKILA